MDEDRLKQEKIIARERLNRLDPEEAQKIVTGVLYADMWKPDLDKDLDWDGAFPLDEHEQ